MPAKIDDAHKAARSLEAYFLRRVLAEVKTSENSITGGGFAGDTFKDMFDEAIADAMANAGGVGMADIIAKQLDPHKGSKGAEAAASAHATAEKSAKIALGADVKAAPIALPRAAGLSAHPVAKLVTDPLGNRALETQATQATQDPVITGVPATSVGTAGTVSLRRYRAAEAPAEAPSSLPAAGRPTDRR